MWRRVPDTQLLSDGGSYSRSVVSSTRGGGRPFEKHLVINPDGSQHLATYVGDEPTIPDFPIITEDRIRNNLEKKIRLLESKLDRPNMDLSKMNNEELYNLDIELYGLAEQRGRRMAEREQELEEQRRDQERQEEEAAYYGYN